VLPHPDPVMGVLSHQPIRRQCLQGFDEGPTHQVAIRKASGSKYPKSQKPKESPMTNDLKNG
jgi:hypothetical protein